MPIMKFDIDDKVYYVGNHGIIKKRKIEFIEIHHNNSIHYGIAGITLEEKYLFNYLEEAINIRDSAEEAV